VSVIEQHDDGGARTALSGTVRPGWAARLLLLPKPLLLTLASVFIASGLTLILSELNVRTAERHAKQIGALRARQESTAALLAVMADVEAAQHGYLLTSDPTYLEAFDRAKASFAEKADRLQARTPEGPTRAQVGELRGKANELLQFAGTTLALHQNGLQTEALEQVRRGEGTQIMGALRVRAAELERQTQLELAALRTAQGPVGFWIRAATILSTLLIFGLLAAVTRLLLAAAMQQQRLQEASAQEALRMQQLVDARTMELSDLSSHLQTVTERDKAELARNLHDELGGLLTAARMDLGSLQSATNAMDADVSQKLHQVNNALTQAMDLKRRIVENLRPALLDHFGLATALQSYFEETCRNAGLDCVTDIPDEIPELSQDLAIALFRVGQESLTNIIRHARARNVELSLAMVNEQVSMCIQDDGVGFETRGRRFRGSHGINGMRYRVEGLGGIFRVISKPGRGTRIEVSVPRDRLEPVVSTAQSAR
jgi:signal transduction histidine kinase